MKLFSLYLGQKKGKGISQEISLQPTLPCPKFEHKPENELADLIIKTLQDLKLQPLQTVETPFSCPSEDDENYITELTKQFDNHSFDNQFNIQPMSFHKPLGKSYY